MNQVDGNNPGGKEASASERFTPVTQRYPAPVHVVTHSGMSPKASTDWAAVVYALMYSLAVFWT